jgi:hypothetical protein
VFLAGAFLFGVAHCTTLKPDDRRSILASGADAQDGESTPDEVPSCISREPPPPPAIVDAGGDLDLVFAAQTSDFGIGKVDPMGRPLYATMGFDLDHRCTTSSRGPNGPSCIEPAGVPVSAYTDLVDGIDNAAGALGQSFAFKTTSLDASADIEQVLFRIRGYNGGADDDRVDFAIYAAQGLVPRADGGVGPYWDGQDQWLIIPDMLASLDGGTPDLDTPLYHDDHAYVANHVVAAQLDETLWPGGVGPGANVLGRVHDFVFAGTLDPGDGGADGWQMHHADTGLRASAQGLLEIWSGLSTDAGLPLCSNALAYTIFKTRLCSLVDVTVAGDSPDAACDGLSGSSRIEARLARLGGVGPESVAPSGDRGCAPHIDPSTDHCP